MADVSRFVPDGPPETRGQMMLVAAFGIAVMLVALALILNTSIYTENIGTRSADISGGKDAVRYHDATGASVAGTMEYANYKNDSSYAHLEANVSQGVETYSNASGYHQGSDGVAANVSLDRQDRGTRVYQNRDRNFTNDTHEPTWFVARDVEDIRNFEMNVTTGDLTTTTVTDFVLDDEFFIVFHVPAGEWHVSIYRDNGNVSGDITVNVKDPSGSRESCTTSPSPARVEINLTEATLAGEDCPALDFLATISTPYDISYNDTLDGGVLTDPTVVGTYTFTVNQSTSTFDSNLLPADSYTANSQPPERTQAIYSTEVHVVYRTHRVHYETDVRVAPGEPE